MVLSSIDLLTGWNAAGETPPAGFTFYKWGQRTVIDKKTQRLTPNIERLFLNAIIANEILCSVFSYPVEPLTSTEMEEIKLEARTRARLQIAPITAEGRNHRGPLAHRMVEALLLSETHLRDEIKILYADKL